MKSITMMVIFTFLISGGKTMAQNTKNQNEYVTEVVINASKEKVWSVLTNFNDYNNWNPFITNIHGSIEENSKLQVTMQIEGMKPTTFTPKVVKMVNHEVFEWYGKSPMGIFNGHHYFRIEETGENQVKLVHGEIFTGWLKGLILKKIGKQTREGFIKMNKALKTACEK